MDVSLSPQMLQLCWVRRGRALLGRRRLWLLRAARHRSQHVDYKPIRKVMVANRGKALLLYPKPYSFLLSCTPPSKGVRLAAYLGSIAPASPTPLQTLPTLPVHPPGQTPALPWFSLSRTPGSPAKPGFTPAPSYNLPSMKAAPLLQPRPSQNSLQQGRCKARTQASGLQSHLLL